MKRLFKYTWVTISLILFAFIILYFNNDIGTYKENIETDVRADQKISDNWKVSKDTTEMASAMIFYDDSHSKNTFSIYSNRDGLSFGYFYRIGGGIAPIGISEFHIDNCNENALISMNNEHVSTIKTNSGNSINVDSTKPFAIIVPNDAGTITAYDINGNTIEVNTQVL